MNYLSPNASSEQRSAIMHRGGKILSAGAGSGKTFVLIEHLVFRLMEIFEASPGENWDKVLPARLGKIVLMTFTKKAAGEMTVRMMRKIDEVCNASREKSISNDAEWRFWESVKKNISYLNILTISSFCHKLISQGFFAGIDMDVNILDSVEYKNKINLLTSSWAQSELTKKNQLIIEFNLKSLRKSMLDIFSSAELRLLWNGDEKQLTIEKELDLFFEEFVLSLGLKDFFKIDVLRDVDSAEKTKQWYLFLSSLQHLVSKEGNISSKNYRQYLDWVFSFKTMPRETKALSHEQVVFLREAKKFALELKEISIDLDAIVENYSEYNVWMRTYQSLYSYIEKNYFLQKGYSFSDLEYYAVLGLRDEDARLKIQKEYDYFIVDEFQDTSKIQYEIIQKLTGGEINKLFCVGDRKQAIYGFRGGEILVFNKCSEDLGLHNNLTLRNNYRSRNKIIYFNNTFFELIFPLSFGYAGSDRMAVEMQAQEALAQSTHAGAVCKYEIEVKIENQNDERKVDLDQLEAVALEAAILNLFENQDVNEVCVLYRKLAPSRYLLQRIIQSGLFYHAQVKIKFEEDPIFYILIKLIEVALAKGDLKKLNSVHFLLGRMVELTGGEYAESNTLDFISHVEVYGPKVSFYKFLLKSKMTNSLFNNNHQVIDSIFNACKDDLGRVYQLLSEEEEGGDYSYNAIGGNGRRKIIFMSAHASKGLEFQSVFLAGIYTNGSQKALSKMVGDFPRSFKWKPVFKSKKFFKSPNYYLESRYLKNRDFSEGKRLLYVACTRAVEFLSWIDLKFIKEEVRSELGKEGNHWINALRIQHSALMSKIETKKIDFPIMSEEERVRNGIFSDLPLVLKDNLGLQSLDEKISMGIMSETSVTRLSLLALCPFKYYLSDICKFPESEIARNQFKSYENIEEGSGQEVAFYSSLKRGTVIHECLSNLIKRNTNLDQLELDSDDKSKLQWVMNEFEEVSRGLTVESEQVIKFSLFGQMISGIPDLVMYNGKRIVVWDFKTGQVPSSDNHYWFQLNAYAFAYKNLLRKKFKLTENESKALTFETSLVYLDQFKIVKLTPSADEICQKLFKTWKKLDNLNQPEAAHCDQCEYSKICLYSKLC